MDVFGAAAQRILLAALAALVAMVFWTGSSDPVNLPKASVAAVMALTLLVVGAVRVIALRRVTVPISPVVFAAVALVAGLVAATVASDVPGASWAGVLGRADGLLLYASCVVCFLTALRVFDAGSARLLVHGLLVGGAFLASYGVLQSAGVDGVSWTDNGLSKIIGTVGNPDFEAAYVGITLPLAAWGLLTRTWGTAWRIGSGALAAACLVVAVASSSVQGLLAGGAGLVVVVAALLLERGDRAGRLALGAVGVGAVLVAAVATVGIVSGVGPGDRLASAGSITARRWYWTAAVDMWRAHPLDGLGLGRFGAYYRAFRPDGAAAVNNYTDSAHSVPLHLLATGGLLVAVPYLVVTGLVLWALARGIWRLEGEAKLLLAGVGGAWLAYQVQSLVSIDQPTLAVTHWLLAACVIVIAAPPRMWERLLPGAAVPKPTKGRAGPTAGPPEPKWDVASVVGAGLVTLLGLLSLWQTLTPLRADRAARVAVEELARRDGNAALVNYDKATARAPYVAAYWLQRGIFLQQVQQLAPAADSYDEGLERDPRSYDLLLAAGELAKSRGDTQAIERYSERLHLIDPSDAWRSRLSS